MFRDTHSTITKPLPPWESSPSAAPTTLKGGPSANQYNSFAQLLLGLTSSVVSELLPFDNNQLTSRQKSYSFYGQDMWQVNRKLTASVGVRWDYFPMGTRASRGMERYDFNTNQMLICGVGGVPTDCGYHIEQKNFSPRVGLAYRPTDTTVIRAGFGINYDPYPLAFVRDMLTNYPEDLLLTINPTVATYGPATQLKDGIPAIQVPDLSSGRVTVPVAYATRSLPDNVVRGYIASWNISLQKQIRGGWMAQAAYVGSRQVKINQRLDLNAGQVLGAGTAGQPYFAKFGRTTATELLTPIGHNKYDSLQTSLQRRMSQGVSVNFNYTFSKVARNLLRRSERRLSVDPDSAVHESESRSHALRPDPHLRRRIPGGTSFRAGKRWAEQRAGGQAGGRLAV